MNATELATRMLEWEHTQRAADALKAEIEAAVLELGKTQTVGNVRATYRAGRKSYDYEAAVTAFADNAANNDDAATFNRIQIISRFHSRTVYDYKSIASELGLDAPSKSQSEPSVTLILLA